MNGRCLGRRGERRRLTVGVNVILRRSHYDSYKFPLSPVTILPHSSLPSLLFIRKVFVRSLKEERKRLLINETRDPDLPLRISFGSPFLSSCFSSPFLILLLISFFYLFSSLTLLLSPFDSSTHIPFFFSSFSFFFFLPTILLCLFVLSFF